MFKVDFIDGKAIKWRKRNGETVKEEAEGYKPRFYINSDRSKLFKTRPWISRQRHVKATSFESWKPTLSKKKQQVLRVDVSSEEKLLDVVNTLKNNFDRSSFRFYNVGFSRQFRFCIQENIEPTPDEKLEKIDLKLHRKHLADRDLSKLFINGEKAGKTRREALEALKQRFSQDDPDIVLVNRGQLLKLLSQELSAENFYLGRIDRFQQLAGENTVSSYGKTVHSNARYNLPGRITIDRSNSFLLGEATLEGLWDLVERSYRPLQELAWGSIGRVLTSIEVKKAYLKQNTLTPWKNWTPEEPKKASKMHKADRGGFIFNPEPGVHRNVYEADFASLFPNIMVKKNISPETVRCNCCENDRVPELDYSICQKQRGFISEVLKPLVDDRQQMKQEIGEIEDEEEKRRVQGSIDAIKWLLVSCFGYMGHAHASYGAIKCHQAINAYDRQIMLEAKEILEQNGYSIVHGIIDSLWIQKKQSAEEFTEACRKVTEEIGIELEPEHRFEWVAFVPRSSTDADIATLNRYFGKKKEGGFKTAGIELEQDSSCSFVKKAQRKMIEALDRKMDEKDVLKILKQEIRKLESLNVPVEELVVEKTASKPLEKYQVENRNVAALKRAKINGIEMKPGQTLRYVVKDDNAAPRERVRLAFETEEEYDTGFYRDRLIKAAESVLSPLGMDENDIRGAIDGKEATLKAFS
ncbi:MAG: type B DNA-directed DNA polymerase [Candidatus Nanohaloarchaea archaeon]